MLSFLIAGAALLLALLAGVALDGSSPRQWTRDESPQPQTLPVTDSSEGGWDK